MKSSNFFKIQDEFPDTHFFIYIVTRNIQYVARNQELFDQNQTISLIDELSEPTFNLTDENINAFIKFIQRKKILIDDDNVVPLNYLAKKYEVASLINITNDYLAQNNSKLALKILSIHQDDPSLDTEMYEQIISQNLKNYIQDEDLLTLKIPVLYRILEQSKLKDDRKEINEFLFKCLKKFGRESSCLFAFADFNDERCEDLKLLLRDFSDVFDFHFIYTKVMKSSYELQNRKIHDEIENKIWVENEIKKLREEIKSVKTDHEQQIEDLNKTHDDQIRSIQDELEEARKSIQFLVDQMKLKDDKNKEQDELIQKLLNDINALKKCHNCIKFEYVNGHEFEGIINYLNSICGGNSHLNGLINVTSSGDSMNKCYNILDGKYKSGKYFYTINKQDSYIQFDFKEHKISIKKYLLLHEEISFNKLINWELVGSNDENTWDQIDERHINEWNGSYDLSTYTTSNNKFYKCIRLRMKGETSSNEYYLILSKIEFFGKFI